MQPYLARVWLWFWRRDLPSRIRRYRRWWWGLWEARWRKPRWPKLLCLRWQRPIHSLYRPSTPEWRKRKTWDRRTIKNYEGQHWTLRIRCSLVPLSPLQHTTPFPPWICTYLGTSTAVDRASLLNSLGQDAESVVERSVNIIYILYILNCFDRPYVCWLVACVVSRLSIYTHWLMRFMIKRFSLIVIWFVHIIVSLFSPVMARF